MNHLYCSTLMVGNCWHTGTREKGCFVHKNFKRSFLNFLLSFLAVVTEKRIYAFFLHKIVPWQAGFSSIEQSTSIAPDPRPAFASPKRKGYLVREFPCEKWAGYVESQHIRFASCPASYKCLHYTGKLRFDGSPNQRGKCFLCSLFTCLSEGCSL